jgi:endonuclease-3
VTSEGSLSDTVSVRAVRATYRALVAAHPDAHCELVHESPFQLVVATALSAQSTDVQVNKVTPGLFAAYPTAKALAAAKQEDVEALINRLGMFRQKAKNLIGMAQALMRDHDGEVPQTQSELVKLPGVGRKTANVVLGVAWGTPEGVVVDTHVQRITQRMGWTQNTTPEKIEQDLMRLLPKTEWDRVSHTLIFHGRRICDARKPACSTCPIHKRCPSAFHAESVGRKPTSRSRSSQKAHPRAVASGSSAPKIPPSRATAKKAATKKTGVRTLHSRSKQKRK